MNMGYPVFMFLFTLGVVFGSINEIGLWQNQLPSQDYQASMSTVNETAQSVISTAPSIFVLWTIFTSFIRVLFTAFLAVFSLSLVFYGMGIPMNWVTAAILQMIQMPFTMVVLFWVYEQATQRSVE